MSISRRDRMELDDGTLELLDATEDLAAAMREKILRNRHKAGLGECTFPYLLKRIEEEADELARAIYPDPLIAQRNPDALLYEAADVANYAMFAWIKARR
jgi:hypothetical protein